MGPPPNSRQNLSSFAATYNPPLSQQPQRSSWEEYERTQQQFVPVPVNGLANSAAPQTETVSPGDQWPPQSARLDPHSNPRTTIDVSSSVEPHKPHKKATKHRKRTPPPGPAGVLFLSRRHSKKHKEMPQRQREANHISDSNKIDDDCEAVQDISTCPAWMFMQKSVGIKTPFLPSYYGVRERYDSLRKHVPSEYILLPEIHRGMYDLRITEKSLIVMVHSINCHGHFDWTVDLLDECGAQIRAWLEPRLVQREQEESRRVRLGVVWCLKDVTMAVAACDTSIESNPKVERMLLVAESNIEETWTPQQAAHEINDKDFLDWMQQRSGFSDGEEDFVQEEEAGSTQQAHSRPSTIFSVESDDSSEEIEPPSVRAAFVQNGKLSERNRAKSHLPRPSVSTQPIPPNDWFLQSQSNASISGSASTPSVPCNVRTNHAHSHSVDTMQHELPETSPASGSFAVPTRSRLTRQISPSTSEVSGTKLSNSNDHQRSGMISTVSTSAQNHPHIIAKTVPVATPRYNSGDKTALGPLNVLDDEHNVTKTQRSSVGLQNNTECERPGRQNTASESIPKNPYGANRNSRAILRNAANNVTDGERNVFRDFVAGSKSDHDRCKNGGIDLGLSQRAEKMESGHSTSNMNDCTEQSKASKSLSRNASSKDSDTSISCHATSALWTIQDDSVMDLFEEVDCEKQEKKTEKISQNHLSAKEKSEGESVAPVPSLFKAGNFDGIDMDELFDEEDD